MKFVLTLAVVVCLIGGCKDKGAGGVTRTPKAVQESYAALLAACKSGNGAEAAELIDSSTVEWWERLRKLALRAPREELKAADFSTRLEVIKLRARVTRADLERLDGKGLFRHLCDQGWTKIGGIDGVTDVVIEGDTATGRMESGGRPMEPIHFVAEGGRWRHKLWEMDEKASRGSQQMWAKPGRDENETIVKVVSQMANKTVGDEIWDPPK